MTLPHSLSFRSIPVSHWLTLLHRVESALFHKFGLKPRVIPDDNQAMGIGGRAKVLGKVEMPSGMGGVNGIVKFSVVDSPGVPPLTPVSLLQQVGAVIDLNSNMDLKKIETMTTLRTLPSGHVAHKLTEFAPGGWKAPTLEKTDLFQVKTDAFRPVTLPGEIKSRSSKQCVGFSSGFVYTVRNQSYPIPSHHQHDPDLCIDDAMSSGLLFDDQLARRTSGFECSFASGFGVNASRQSVGLNGCVRQKTWRMRRQHELCPLSCIDRSQRSKSQNERKEERSYHDQSKSRTDCRGCSHQGERRRCMSKMRPRTLCLQHRFGTDSTLEL